MKINRQQIPAGNVRVKFPSKYHNMLNFRFSFFTSFNWCMESVNMECWMQFTFPDRGLSLSYCSIFSLNIVHSSCVFRYLTNTFDHKQHAHFLLYYRKAVFRFLSMTTEHPGICHTRPRSTQSLSCRHLPQIDSFGWLVWISLQDKWLPHRCHSIFL